MPRVNSTTKNQTIPMALYAVDAISAIAASRSSLLMSRALAHTYSAISLLLGDASIGPDPVTISRIALGMPRAVMNITRVQHRTKFLAIFHAVPPFRVSPARRLRLAR